MRRALGLQKADNNENVSVHLSHYCESEQHIIKKEAKEVGGGGKALKETKQTMNGKGTHMSHCGPPWATSLKFPIVNTIQELQFYSK